MKKNLFFVLIAMLTMASCVFAAEWIQIGEKSYLDVSSLSPYEYNHTDVTYSIWKKSLNDGTDTWKNLEKILGKKLWYSKVLFVINCTKKEIGIKSAIHYDLNENVADSNEFIYLNWQSVVPETNGEFMYALVCSVPDNAQRKVDKKIIETPAGVKIKVRSHR
ncbi:hypothetical protein J6G99_08615 [bacterium]|nr:hypothetical protein [bacterium]